MSRATRLRRTARARVAQLGVDPRHAVRPPAPGVDVADGRRSGRHRRGPAPRAVASTRPSSRWARHRAPGTSWPPGGWPSLARRSGTRSPGLVGLPCEEGRGFFQDLPLGAESPVLAPQPHELGPLVARQALGLASIDLGLDDPAAERLVADAEIRATSRVEWPGARAKRTASARKSAGYGAVPRGMWTPFSGARCPNSQVSTEPGQLHTSG